jgi:hypothetical protein
MNKQLLLEAASEIDSLRRQNETLRAKVEVMDLFACVLHTQPATYNPPMGVDVAWSLRQEFNRITAEHNIKITNP